MMVPMCFSYQSHQLICSMAYPGAAPRVWHWGRGRDRYIGRTASPWHTPPTPNFGLSSDFGHFILRKGILTFFNVGKSKKIAKYWRDYPLRPQDWEYVSSVPPRGAAFGPTSSAALIWVRILTMIFSGNRRVLRWVSTKESPWLLNYLTTFLFTDICKNLFLRKLVILTFHDLWAADHAR